MLAACQSVPGKTQIIHRLATVMHVLTRSRATATTQPLDDKDLVLGPTWHPSAAARYTECVEAQLCTHPLQHPLRPSVGTDETHHRHHFLFFSDVLLILVCKGIRGQNSAVGNIASVHKNNASSIRSDLL